MAQTKISELPAAAALSGTELIEAVQSGTNVKTTVQDIANKASSGGVTWVTKTANYTSVSGNNIYCDSSGAAFTITLPSSPSTNDVVTIKSGQSAGTHNITIGRNSQTIMSISEDMIISTPNIQVTFIFNGTTWAI